MNMKIIFLFFLLAVFSSAASAQCYDELRSYHKVWTLEARAREESREERQKYYASLTPEERTQISDAETYPTSLMTCSMGFSGRLAKIFVDGKAGFIDPKGKIVIKPEFKDAGRFSENLAPVEFENGKWGYIDKTGKIAIKPAFEWALVFREGLALVQVGAKWGFVDTNGNMVVKPQFDHANSFSEGLAHVQVYKEKFYSGYIDKKGNWVIQPVFNGGLDFSGGKTIVDQDELDEKGRYKYTTCFLINKTGEKLEELEECSKTLAAAKMLDSDEITLFFDGYKTGYKNKTGRIIWKPTK